MTIDWHLAMRIAVTDNHSAILKCFVGYLDGEPTLLMKEVLIERTGKGWHNRSRVFVGDDPRPVSEEVALRRLNHG